jgi:phosphatidylserine/phosphatidylglycerophosphate/cardiolipin synthase-like enzyme
LDLIERAREELFLVSFVAYDVPAVVERMNAAIQRNVAINVLLESSTGHGGTLSNDQISAMKRRIPAGNFYVWSQRSDQFAEGRVHAKVVVADDAIAFLTSANLTGHALEKNMEAGVVIHGGAVPKSLRSHLHALITTRVIAPI